MTWLASKRPRTLPFSTSNAIDLVTEMRISAPADYALAALPASFTESIGGTAVSIEALRDGEAVVIRRRLQLAAGVTAASDVPALQRLLRKANATSRSAVTFVRKKPG